VLRLGKPILWHDGVQTALQLGVERRASVVIWGDFDTTPDSVIVSTNVELIPGLALKHRRSWNTSTDKLSELHHFTLQQRLSREITYNTLFILGLIHYNTGDAAGSIGPLTDALAQIVADQKNPKDILFTRSRAFFELGRYEDALADLDRVIAIDPTYDHALNNRGVANLALGAYEQGVSDLTAAIALKPDDALAYRNRSGAYYDLRKLDLAIADANIAIARDSRDPLGYVVRGNARDRKGDFDGALSDYGLALKLSPQNSWAYLNRGIAYQWHEDYTKAIADFDRAIRAEPTFVEAYRARAITYWKKMGRSQEAAEDFRAILKLPASNEAKEEARSALEELRNAERR